MTTFTEETSVVIAPDQPGRYEAHLSRSWWGPRAPHGGVAATTLRAMTAQLDNSSLRLRTSTAVLACTVPASQAVSFAAAS